MEHPVSKNTRDTTSIMATPTASHLDDLALQTKIADYGDFRYFPCNRFAPTNANALWDSIVTIPGCEHLTPSERWEITLKAQQLQAGNSLDAERLCAALRQVPMTLLLASPTTDTTVPSET